MSNELGSILRAVEEMASGPQAMACPPARAIKRDLEQIGVMQSPEQKEIAALRQQVAELTEQRNKLAAALLTATSAAARWGGVNTRSLGVVDEVDMARAAIKEAQKQD